MKLHLIKTSPSGSPPPPSESVRVLTDLSSPGVQPGSVPVGDDEDLDVASGRPDDYDYEYGPDGDFDYDYDGGRRRRRRHRGSRVEGSRQSGRDKSFSRAGKTPRARNPSGGENEAGIRNGVRDGRLGRRGGRA